jgi:predicted DNA-binding transcriptional regulator YafY
LDEAITKNKKVAFIYNSYGADKKLHPKREIEYIVNPYQMVATNGRYYLVCNYDKYDTISNYRVDRITKIRISSIQTSGAILSKSIKKLPDKSMMMAQCRIPKKKRKVVVIQSGLI